MTVGALRRFKVQECIDKEHEITCENTCLYLDMFTQRASCSHNLAPPPSPLPPLGLSPAWRSSTAPSSVLACRTDGRRSPVLACHARHRCEAESDLSDASQ
eukprot:COSAG02_NODE_471_length_21662_cov_70.510040_21_plen_101_part_00